MRSSVKIKVQSLALMFLTNVIVKLPFSFRHNCCNFRILPERAFVALMSAKVDEFVGMVRYINDKMTK